MKFQKDLVKILTKIEFNSIYKFSPIRIIPINYDENKALKIMEEGKKNLTLIQEAMKNI
jgi:hypothetical protein